MARVDMPLRELSFHEEKLRAIFYLVIVPALIVLTLFLIFLDYRAGVHRTVRQEKVNKAQIEQNRRQIKTLRNALAETCHATTAEFGITSSLILYLSAQPQTPATVTAIETLTGFADDLSTKSACRQVANP
jgi:hypothetical protein